MIKKIKFLEMYYVFLSMFQFRSCKVRSAVMIKKIKFLEMYYVFLSMFHHVP